MAADPTMGELYAAKAISGDDIIAAVDAFMAALLTTMHLISDGFVRDLLELVC